MTAVSLIINGRTITADVTPRTHLADFLRDSLNLTGTHIGCEHGVCGACTVDINGELSRACITYAVACEGAAIRTIENFDDDAVMARLRDAFTAEHALQCGFCTPGMLIAARDLIRRCGLMSAKDIRTEMSGNLCRCTGYAGIVRAIARVMTEVSTDAMTAKPANTWLGPAPGPTAGVSAIVPQMAPAVTFAAPAGLASDSKHAITVETGDVRQEGASTRLTQSFTLEQPIAAVWSKLCHLSTVIACMPGAVLDAPPADDGAFSAHMSLRLGPIRTTLAGDGIFSADEDAKTCRVAGRGRDRAGPSSVNGEIVYRVSAIDPTRTRVEADIGYSLTGPLAQFGRPVLVHGLVTHMGESFARNLAAEIAGRSPGTRPQDELGFASVVWAIFKSWLDRLLGRE